MPAQKADQEQITGEDEPRKESAPAEDEMDDLQTISISAESVKLALKHTKITVKSMLDCQAWNLAHVSRHPTLLPSTAPSTLLPLTAPSTLACELACSTYRT